MMPKTKKNSSPFAKSNLKEKKYLQQLGYGAIKITASVQFFGFTFTCVFARFLRNQTDSEEKKSSPM